MKRLFKKQMNKRPNKKRRILFIVVLLATVAGVGGYIWYQNQQGVSGLQYEMVLSEVYDDIANQSYGEAKSKLAKLDRSKGGHEDYRVYAAYADISNYEKQSEDAKRLAKKAIDLYSSSNFQNEEVTFRLESYIDGIYVPHASETDGGYEVPAETIEDEGFQG